MFIQASKKQILLFSFLTLSSISQCSSMTLLWSLLGVEEKKPTTLHEAARIGDVATLKKMLEEGADITKQESFQIPLDIAIYNNQGEAALLLIEADEKGVTLTRKDEKDRTVLHTAACNGLARVVQKICAKKPEWVNLADTTEHKRTPLMYAITRFKTEAELVFRAKAVEGLKQGFFESYSDWGKRHKEASDKWDHGIISALAYPEHRALTDRYLATIEVLVKYGAELYLESRTRKREVHKEILATCALEWRLGNNKEKEDDYMNDKNIIYFLDPKEMASKNLFINYVWTVDR